MVSLNCVYVYLLSAQEESCEHLQVEKTTAST